MTQAFNALDCTPQFIIANSRSLLQIKYPKKKCQQISQKIKGLVLFGLISKYNNKKKLDDKEQIINHLYSKVQAHRRKPIVLQTIFCSQSISELIFLYRIKRQCRKTEYCVENQRNQDKLSLKLNNLITESENLMKNALPNLRIYSKRENQLQKEQQKKVSLNKQNTSSSQAKNKHKKQISKTHLRCISEQKSVLLSSQIDLSQKDIFEQFDSRLINIHTRLVVSALRSVQLLINKISYQNKKLGLQKIINI